MKKLFFALCVLLSQISFSQGEANNWYFGIYAGLSFNTTPPTALTDGQLSTLEGCTTISDSSGNLLFYTDGSVVYNKNHQAMLNGTGLKGHKSSTSSALIVPQPQSTHIYYIFTVDEPHHLYADNNTGNDHFGDGVNDGFMYSIVDMDLDNGNGAVVPGQKNIQLITYDPNDALQSAYKCSEKITAVKSNDCSSFWVISHFIDSFYAFKVTENGIEEQPVISTVGVTVPLSGYRRNALGYIKASPEGDKLAVAHLGLATITGGEGPGMLALYDFDNETGIVSNELQLHDSDSPYGVEFSPSGNRFYASIGIGDAGNYSSWLFQYDLTVEADAIAETVYSIPNENGAIETSNNSGALQLGPDGRIYRALYNFQNTQSGNYLGVIKNPEALGSELEYTESEVLVNVDGARRSQIGLPPFIQSIFAERIDIVHLSEEEVTTNLNLCDSDSFLLYYDEVPSATYSWFKNGELLVDETSYELLVTQPSTGSLPLSETYRLEVDLNDGSCPLIGYANLTFNPFPEEIDNLPDANFCFSQDESEETIFNFSEIENNILATQAPDLFQVFFFLTQQDAEQKTNILPTDFSVLENETQIFVRLENINNPNCFIVQDFTLFTYENAEINSQTIVDCLNADGSDTIFDLKQFALDIIENPDPFIFDSSFYYSLEDAENEENEILDPENFILNDVPSIFLKLKNLQFEQCEVIKEIEIQLNDFPEVFNASLSQCSVENGGPNSWFNLTHAETEITNQVGGLSVQYFTTYLNAQNSEYQIENPEAFQNITNPQTVYVKVTNDQTGCYAIAELLLTLNMTEGNNSVLIACDEDGNSDGFSSFNLTSANEDILDGLPTGLQISYYATQQNALLEIDPLPHNYTNTTAYNQIIFVRMEDGNSNCYALNKLELIVEDLPQLMQDEQLYYCEEWFPEPIQLQAGLLGNVNFHTYEWTPGGETSPSILVNETGTYTVTVTNTLTGCFEERQFIVAPSNAAVIEEVVVEGIEFNNTVTVVFSGESTGSYLFSLNNPSGPYQAENVFLNVAPGFHTIYVKDENGCPTAAADISVLGFPKFFTPNNDGHNDYWQVLGVSETSQPDAEIFIFNRYGKLLAQLNPKNVGWDGRYNGKNMPIDDYWYQVNLKNGKQYQGHFSLKR